MDWIETGAIGERIMEQQYYDDIWNWKLNGMLPSNLPSTASNFRATAAKYYVCHVKNILMRNGKIVLRKEPLPESENRGSSIVEETKLGKELSHVFTLEVVWNGYAKKHVNVFLVGTRTTLLGPPIYRHSCPSHVHPKLFGVCTSI